MTPLLNYFQDIKKTICGDNIYYEVSYKGLDIVIAYSKIGKVFAALTASTMIQTFGCDMLLFSGVAGGINPKLKIGDLIIANRLCQHDLDITAFGHPYGYVPEGKQFILPNQDLISIAKDIAKKNNLNLIEGTIATGDQFVNSEQKKGFIQNTFQADALEMEGGSVAVICDSLSIPFLILRAISDTANGEADFDFDEFLESSAKKSADYLMEIVKSIQNI